MYREAAAELEAGISVAGRSPVMLEVAGHASDPRFVALLQQLHLNF